MFEDEGEPQSADCPWGGCLQSLSDAERNTYSWVRAGLCALARRYHPRDKAISTDPLFMIWSSALAGHEFAVVLAFTTRDWTMEMVFLEAEMIEARKFHLKQHDVGCEAWTDESWSLKLAKLSHSWVVSVCVLGPVEGAMDVFDYPKQNHL